jgi:putative ABC transport system ATP-binding protein
MSGGQQQRVAIARALVHDPPLVVADEPTAHLDYIQVEGVLSLIREIAQPGRTVVVATHDERIIPLADRVVDLSPKKRIAARPPERVELARGDVLFNQGDAGELIYVVEQGEIEIFRVLADHTEDPLTVVRPGEHFGELAPLLGLRRTASARAHTNVVLTGYSVVDFRKMAGSDPKLARLFAVADEPKIVVTPSRATRTKRPAPAKRTAARRVTNGKRTAARANGSANGAKKRIPAKTTAARRHR